MRVPELPAMHFVDEYTSRLWSQQAAMQSHSRHGLQGSLAGTIGLSESH